ncbi:CesT family type III secretion system chaperone [Robbsia sp. Bb-Pol-6]|uniref:CesT family type III secretion system chaperone n=1 Tax=Robbsia betulipollinis TaxID=2981849 RepID=A0ABT3ZKJ7_9BURK|nr:CesT family type III secretion system chaperone [Robbsia betulipollinis]MCY0387053.1 CesT family type III secretion system chaperone [Robbsia betulipollinis]
MSLERRNDLIAELCGVLDIPGVDAIVEAGKLQANGFDVAIDFFEEDPDAIYLNFEYGIVGSGRTLRIFRLLLESNLLIYAQDQAQLGLDPDTGGIILLLRVPLSDDVDGIYLGELLDHYAEHGRYWKNNILESSDEMFDNIASGAYTWIRA